MSNARILAQAAAAPSALKNRLLNGAFDVWQRGTSFTGTYNNQNGYYGADRWQMFRAGGAGGCTWSKIWYNGPDSSFAARMQRNQGDTQTNEMYMAQSLESIDVYTLRGRQVTLSFRVLAGANFSGVSMWGTVVMGTGTDGSLASGFTNTVNLTPAVSMKPGTTQTYVTATVTVPMNASQLGVSIGYAPTGTAGANDYIEVTNVQLEVGPVATPFERRHVALETLLCMRYYQQIGGSWNYVYGRFLNWGASTTSLLAGLHYIAPLRVAPTVWLNYDISDSADSGWTALAGETNTVHCTHVFTGIAPGTAVDIKGYIANAEL